MTENLLAMQLIVGSKTFEVAKGLVGAQDEEDILNMAEELEIIATYIKRKLIEGMLAERESSVNA